MAFNLESLIGGSIGDAFQKIMSVFKVDPTVALQQKTEIEKIQLELAGKLQDAIADEIKESAEVIKAEAQSQSWLPRNVRPLCLLMWAVLITFNFFIPIISRVFHYDFQPIVLDPWVYKLTAIGFTGYVTARTWEKVKDSDN
jgi:holin (3TMs family)